jgi:SAM-dependent methyltransferase
MSKNFLLKSLQEFGARQRHLGIERSNAWAGITAAELKPDSLLDVGCGDGSMLARYLKVLPREYCGAEGSPELKVKAEQRGMKVSSFDLNGRWPYPDDKFDVVISTQVIEHLHNTRLFVEEMFRVLKPGGTAIVTSENLCSLLNCSALLLGYTPFSLMQVCGRFYGNPLGLHYGEPIEEHLPIDHPAFAGVAGHIRVLTVIQAREIFARVGFEADAHSVSILPLPDGLSRLLERFIRDRGHYLNVKARKPVNPPVKI